MNNYSETLTKIVLTLIIFAFLAHKLELKCKIELKAINNILFLSKSDETRTIKLTFSQPQCIGTFLISVVHLFGCIVVVHPIDFGFRLLEWAFVVLVQIRAIIDFFNSFVSFTVTVLEGSHWVVCRVDYVVEHIIVSLIRIFPKLGILIIILHRCCTKACIRIISVNKGGIVCRELSHMITVLFIVLHRVELYFGVRCHWRVCKIVDNISILVQLKVKLSELLQQFILFQFLNLFNVFQFPPFRFWG